jgi:hypothetical protein
VRLHYLLMDNLFRPSRAQEFLVIETYSRCPDAPSGRSNLGNSTHAVAGADRQNRSVVDVSANHPSMMHTGSSGTAKRRCVSILAISTTH